MLVFALTHATFIIKGSVFVDETPIKEIHVYDILTDTWDTRAGLPEGRHRAGGASVYYKGKIYVSHGGGHGASPSTGKLDAYDIDKDEWITGLPDAPNPREHVGGGLVNGSLLCVGGGRIEDDNVETALDFFIPTDCYNIETGTWSEHEPLPRGRRASAYDTTCDGKFIVSGGIALGETSGAVDVFDGETWKSLADHTVPRFGHGIAVNCDCNQMYIAGGVPSLNGIPFNNLLTAETYFTTGDEDEECS